MRKRSFLLIAGACLATLSLTIGSAMADPSNPAGPRDLAGTGSDTTQGVMNGLSDVVKINNNKVIASYDATGSAQITTKGTTGSAPCTMNRPSGSGAGIDALVASLAANGGAGDGCLQFARSSKNDSANRGGKNLVYIPFAVDQIGYATKISSSNIPPPCLSTTCDRSTTAKYPLSSRCCHNLARARERLSLPRSASPTRPISRRKQITLVLSRWTRPGPLCWRTRERSCSRQTRSYHTRSRCLLRNLMAYRLTTTVSPSLAGLTIWCRCRRAHPRQSLAMPTMSFLRVRLVPVRKQIRYLSDPAPWCALIRT